MRRRYSMRGCHRRGCGRKTGQVRRSSSVAVGRNGPGGLARSSAPSLSGARLGHRGGHFRRHAKLAARGATHFSTCDPEIVQKEKDAPERRGRLRGGDGRFDTRPSRPRIAFTRRGGTTITAGCRIRNATWAMPSTQTSLQEERTSGKLIWKCRALTRHAAGYIELYQQGRCR